jgi:DNA polymerase (family 10)
LPNVTESGVSAVRNVVCRHHYVNALRKDLPRRLSNGEIASELMTLAQLLAGKGENPFKIKAYRRAARMIRSLGESIHDLAASGADLTTYPSIGPAIQKAIQEMVQTGTLRHVQELRAAAPAETTEIAQYPGLDIRRVRRAYKKLGIGSVSELRDKLESGEVLAKLGPRMAQHIRQGLSESSAMLLYEADKLVPAIRRFLVDQCGVSAAEPAGEYRRRVEVVDDLALLVETGDLESALTKLQEFGGRSEIVSAAPTEGTLHLSSGVLLKVIASTRPQWGLNLILATGSAKHLQSLRNTNLWGSLGTEGLETEAVVYSKLGLPFIPPELREGEDEIAQALGNGIPAGIIPADIRGELHAHSTSSDGVNTIEEMATAAREHGYEYIGISDHSQTLKIARGLSEQELWTQIRNIDTLNKRLDGIQVLKSAEVDILADGSLDYPDELLKELDYTVCSIHSRFGMGKADQTERLLRAMDNRYFNILGHATGRLLLKRPGYEIDMARVVEHAAKSGCYFEINSSPDRLDLSAANARVARQAGVKVAINTDAHSTYEFKYLNYGIDQARRAGFGKESILNHYALPELRQLFKR